MHDGRSFLHQHAGVRVIGMLKDVVKLPLSTTCPLFMTRMRSATLEMAPRSWVMNSMAVFFCFLIRINSSRISYWVMASMAVVGSSAIRSSGCRAMAMPIMIRWSMPPESWCGYFSRTSSPFRIRICSRISRERVRISCAFQEVWVAKVSAIWSLRPRRRSIRCCGQRTPAGHGATA